MPTRPAAVRPIAVDAAGAGLPADAGRMREWRGLRRREVRWGPGAAGAAGTPGLFGLGEGFPAGDPVHRSRWTRVVRLRGGPLAGAIHKMTVDPFPRLLWSLVFPASAVREFCNLRRLRARGFPAVEPLAAGASGWGPLTRRAFLVTRELPDAVSLGTWADARRGRRRRKRPAAGEAAERLTREEVLAVTGQLVEAVAALHADGVRLGTLFAKNVLVGRDGEGRTVWAVCDTPRATSSGRGRPARRGAVRDLAALDKWGQATLTRAERLRLLRRYLAARGVAVADRRAETRRWASAVAVRRGRLQRRSPAGRLRLAARRALRALGIATELPDQGGGGGRSVTMADPRPAPRRAPDDRPPAPSP